ncbi:hypothetical protein E4U54_007107 [Claviceps lovelessii]|nr:hypothetical protein E4U54_007107 [Claviceps lovelessii]
MVVVSVKGLDLWYTNSIVEPSSVKWPDGEQATTTLIDPAVRSQHTDADFQFFIPQDMTVRDCIRSIVGMSCNEDDDNPDKDDTGSDGADGKTLAKKHPKSSRAKPSQAREKGRKRTRVSSPAFVGVLLITAKARLNNEAFISCLTHAQIRPEFSTCKTWELNVRVKVLASIQRLGETGFNSCALRAMTEYCKQLGVCEEAKRQLPTNATQKCPVDKKPTKPRCNGENGRELGASM